MSDIDIFRTVYFEECSELLQELETLLSGIAEGDDQADALNGVFRAVHSIKGGAGAFGFDALVTFTHSFETLLDHVRQGEVAPGPEVVALCLRATDIVADLVMAAREGTDLPEGFGEAERAAFEALSMAAGSPGADDEGGLEDFDIDFTPVAVDIGARHAAPEPAPEAPSGWSIRFVPHARLLATGSDPLVLIRALGGLGRLTVSADTTDLPGLEAFDPEASYCRWSMTLSETKAGRAEIEEVFSFVEDACDLEIVPVFDAIDPAWSEDGPEDAFPDFAALMAEAGLAPSPPAGPEAADMAPEPAPEAPSQAVVLPGPAVAGSEAGPSAGAPARGGLQTIRVELEKVDRVVNMVGELVITQSMLAQQVDDTIRDRYPELVRGLEVLAQTTRGLQDAVMAIRAQPVKSVFQRMPRLVRELATKTGKSLRLDMEGEGTEIDKTVIEQLSDPLTHMVRNSADHGIETPAERIAAGKPETGTIRLSAQQSGSTILVVVEDDGRGIDRGRVLALARERGVVAPDHTPTDEQIDNLIFAPGFSTAEAVSDISGRGVGMDVVLSNIRRIGGSVQVRSLAGRGTRMTLRLPLTLAVLDVMVVSVAGHPYVIALSSIIETLETGRAEFSTLPSGERILRLRGDYVPVVDLSARFGLAGAQKGPGRFVVLCEAEGETRLALVVDEVIGQQQVVIKSLEENFEHVEAIAGGTILGDGNVALILDVDGLRPNGPRRSAA
ncbi:chemotaxis protein CheA [Pelagibacterium montanilacus]|uniref:chemotaxis protein CheA n=1 Tax=Pelagibacterium montanilacus TaxID=2185280 RepID=UPI000F8EDDF1|nr:chemotaxis protein CheA [Pelagibacterium montanilacus]